MKHNSIRQMWQALRVFMLLFACCVSSIDGDKEQTV